MPETHPLPQRLTITPKRPRDIHHTVIQLINSFFHHLHSPFGLGQHAHIRPSYQALPAFIQILFLQQERPLLLHLLQPINLLKIMRMFHLNIRVKTIPTQVIIFTFQTVVTDILDWIAPALVTCVLVENELLNLGC